MTDNYTPGIQNPNNYPVEKPLYDSGEASAPIPQNVQPNYYPNQNYYPNNQIVNPGYNSNTNTYEQPYYVNNMNTNVNNNYYQNDFEVPKSLLCKQYTISILLYICAIIDIILQIVFGIINPFSMVDDVAIFIVASIFLTYSCKNKSARNKIFGFFTGVVWFVGFGCKGFAMTFMGSRHNGSMIPILFFLIVIRTFLLFFSIPLACETQRR